MRDARPAEPLSIFSLAAGIACLVLGLFSLMPLMSMCTLPLSAIAAALAFITGVVSVIQTFRKPELDGRMQALMGIGLSLFWGVMIAIFIFAVTRNH